MKVLHSSRNRGAVENHALVKHWRPCQFGESRHPAATNCWSRHGCLSGELRAAGCALFQNEFSEVVWYG